MVRLTNEKKNEFLNEIRKFAKENSIELISKEFKNDLAPIEFKCEKCDSYFADCRKHIIYRKKLPKIKCPTCSPDLKRGKKKTKEDYIKEIRSLAEANDIILLSTEYINKRSPLQFLCKICSQDWWDTRELIFKRLKRRKFFRCPYCFPDSFVFREPNKEIPQTLKKSKEQHFNEIETIVNEKKGSILSKEYVGAEENVHIKCENGHEWFPTPHNLKSGHWCPICNQNLYERFCRQMFEAIFGVKFPQTPLRKIIYSSEIPINMHLDGYNKELKIGFERHGIQHYKYKKFFHGNDIDNFHQQLKVHEFKRKICEENEMVLIEVGYKWCNGKLHKINFDEMEVIIREKLKEKGIKPPIAHEPIEWENFNLTPPSWYEEIKQIVEGKGGVLLTPFYPGSHGIIEINCGNSHYFKTTPTQLKYKKSWCRKCYEERRKNERDNFGRFISYI